MYDLYSIEKYTLKPLERKLFRELVSCRFQAECMVVLPRSGMAFKQGIDVMAGVIDEDYRNEVGVVLINLSNEDVAIPVVKDGKETAIAQIIFEFYNNVNVNIVEELNDTERGQGGFGSSNAKKKVKSPKEANSLVDKWKESGAKPPHHQNMKR